MSSKKTERDAILSAIIQSADAPDLITQAIHALRRPDTDAQTLWRIYRYALQDDLSRYPSDVVAAMRAFDDQMTSKLPENQKTTIQIRCTVNQRAILHHLAAQHGMTLTDYILDRCLR